MNYETAAEIEVALAYWLGARQNLMVPNVSWGLLDYECDLMVLLQSGYAAEIEIKITRSDLRRDQEKKHKHNSNLMRYLYFAVPEKLKMDVGEIPERAGIVIVKPELEAPGYSYGSNVELVRRPQANAMARKLTDAEKFRLARLGALRIWDLKRALMERKQVKAEEVVNVQTI